MKKFRLLVSLVITLALLSGCAHTTGEAGSRAAAPILDRILQKKELVVGTAGNMPPLNMTTKEGNIIGLEADLARYMAAGMGVKLRMDAIPFSGLLPALESGRVDMVLSGMTITPRRNLNVAFVGPYYVTGKAFLTKEETIAAADEATEVDSPDVTIAVLSGSTSQIFAEEVLPRVNLVATGNYDEAVEMVIEGKAHALIADYPICYVSLLRYPDRGLLSIFTTFTYEPLGIAIPAGDPQLINWVENFLTTLEGSGKLDELKEKWFEESSWLKELPEKVPVAN